MCDEPAVLHDRTLLTTTWGRSHARSGLCEGCSMPPIAHGVQYRARKHPTEARGGKHNAGIIIREFYHRGSLESYEDRDTV